VRYGHCASILPALHACTARFLFDILLLVCVSKAYGSESSAGDDGKYSAALAAPGSSPDTPRPTLGESVALELKPCDELTCRHSTQHCGKWYSSSKQFTYTAGGYVTPQCECDRSWQYTVSNTASQSCGDSHGDMTCVIGRHFSRYMLSSSPVCRFQSADGLLLSG